METVTLMIPDEHPLLDLGCTGWLGLVDGVQIRLVGVTGGSLRRRRLPRRERMASCLMAEGKGPLELAERLGLCLERAEALHEELRRKLGLDRIAGQVRSAIHVGLLQSGGPEPLPASAVGNLQGGRAFGGGKSMSDEDLVRIFFPEALAQPRDSGGWEVLSDAIVHAHRLGLGQSEPDAWASALVRLWRDEWFRPIIVQFRSMGSELPGKA